MFKRLLIIGSALLSICFLGIAQAQIQLSGPLNGVLEDTTYLVVDSIYVLDGDSLIIPAGASLLFAGHFNFRIYGYLTAIGTEEDSIYFMPAVPGDSLKSIIFQQLSSDSCAMAYCYITGCTGSAINSYYISLSITHCTITGNRASWGGGIYFSFCNGTISDCIITDNICGNNGGGIYCTNSSPTITNCIVTGNLCNTLPTTSSGRGGGGICANHLSSPIITGCTISNNHSLWNGGGLSFNDNSEVRLTDCLIADNSCDSSGGGIAIFSLCEPIITNCTLSGDSAALLGGGIYVNESAPTIINTIVAGSRGNGGIFFDAAPSSAVSYSDFHNPLTENFAGGIPTDLGLISTVNANSDSCDMFFNIVQNPLFVNPDTGDFRLTAESPCLDAGDPDSLYIDPDSTIADVGAFYFPHDLGIRQHQEKFIPETFFLGGNYPNPFNPVTTITFGLPVANWVALEVFDISGRNVGARHASPLRSGSVTTPTTGTWFEAGVHNITFDGSGLPSGIYIYRIEVGAWQASGKMVLLK